MQFYIMTLFPEMVMNGLNTSIIGRAMSKGLLSIEAKTRWKDKRVYFVPHKTFREEYFMLHGENSSVLDLPDNAQMLY